MNPGTWNRTIYRGTDHTWPLRRLDADGQPIIPTSAHAQVRNRFGGDVWLDASSEATTGVHIEIDAVDGWVTVFVPEDATEGALWDHRDRGVWDVEVDVDGARYRWAMGNIVVSQDVTR